MTFSLRDTTIRVYDRDSLSQLNLLACHTGPVNSVALHPDPSMAQMVSASADGKWVISDLVTGKEIRRGAGDGRGLASIAWKVSGLGFRRQDLAPFGRR